MNHFQNIADRLEAYGLDAMLLSCEANRFYASGFHSTITSPTPAIPRPPDGPSGTRNCGRWGAEQVTPPG